MDGLDDGRGFFAALAIIHRNCGDRLATFSS